MLVQDIQVIKNAMNTARKRAVFSVFEIYFYLNGQNKQTKPNLYLTTGTNSDYNNYL